MTTTPLPTIADDLLDELERAAKVATPGPWYESNGIGVVIDEINCETICETYEDDPRDARHIAAANPATVLALIARIRELEKDEARMNWFGQTEDVRHAIDVAMGRNNG